MKQLMSSYFLEVSRVVIVLNSVMGFSKAQYCLGIYVNLCVIFLKIMQAMSTEYRKMYTYDGEKIGGKHGQK